MFTIAPLVLLTSLIAFASSAELDPSPVAPKPTEPWLTLEPAGDGPGQGKHIVFVTGDEEYRSEEGMPQLAKILAKHHGFRCTVLFAIDPESGTIDPMNQENIPGTDQLAKADLMVIFTRFRDLPDAQMKPIVEYVEAGKPIVGLRTSTHAFDPKKYKTYARFGWRNGEWKGGFGRQVLGETWIAHHGGHGSQSTGGILADKEKAHPVLLGLSDREIWDPTDVYTVRLPMLEGIRPLVYGQVLDGMKFDSPKAKAVTHADGKVTDKNDPMMPVAWVRDWKAPNGKTSRIFGTTLGTSQAFVHEGTRRLLVNACYWALGLEAKIDPKSKVDVVGKYEPTPFGFRKHKAGVKPSDLR